MITFLRGKFEMLFRGSAGYLSQIFAGFFSEYLSINDVSHLEGEGSANKSRYSK